MFFSPYGPWGPFTLSKDKRKLKPLDKRLLFGCRGNTGEKRWQGADKESLLLHAEFQASYPCDFLGAGFLARQNSIGATLHIGDEFGVSEGSAGTFVAAEDFWRGFDVVYESGRHTCGVGGKDATFRRVFEFVGTGPGPAFRGIGQMRFDGVVGDIEDGVVKMGWCEREGGEASLPEMSPPVLA